MSALNLEQIKQRAENATAGPWKAYDQGADDGDEYGWHVFSQGDTLADWINVFGDLNAADAAFVSHAREDIPALLARVEELEAALRGHGLATCTCGRVYCLISDGETIHCRCGAMLSAATSIVRASLPVREETT